MNGSGERAASAPGGSLPGGDPGLPAANAGQEPGRQVSRRQHLPRFRRIGRREGFDLPRRGSGRAAGVSSNEWFVVYARPNRLGVSRLGVTVPKRVAPRANARNFAKRLVREGFRRGFPVECAVNVIVRVRKQLDRNTAQQGAEALARLLQGVQEKCGEY